MKIVAAVVQPMRIIWVSLLLVLLFSTQLLAQKPDTLRPNDILNMSFIDLMNQQVISASKTSQQIKDVAATVQVITAEEIKNRGYFTLEEALSDLPGFQFRNINGFNSYIFMRGAPSQNNLILLLVDGVQINELNSGGFYGGGQFNLSDIERIEVVYGPASALYGTNAVSGIINIITKKPEGKNAGHVSLLGGNFKTGEGNFSIENYNAKKETGYYISGMYKTTNKADLRGAKGDDNWTDNMENFEHDISFSAKVVLKNFTAAAVYQEKKSSNTTYYKSIGEPYLDKNSLWDIAFLNAYLKYHTALGKKWELTSTLYNRNATVKPNTIDHVTKATDTTTGEQVGYYRPNHLTGLETQFNFKTTDNLMVIFGIIGETEQLADGFSVSKSNSEYIVPPEPSKPIMLNNQLFSYYVQADLKITKQFSFIGGLRHDFSSYYGKVITPRTGLIFNKDQFTAKLLYNTAFRAPKPWDYHYGIGNNALKPEKMQSYELVFSYTLSDKFSLGTSVYRNLIKNKLTKETTGTTTQWINRDRLNTFGVEFYSNFSIQKFLIYANYTYTDSYDQDGIYIPEISAHTANIGTTYSYDSHFKVNLRSHYIGTRKNPSIIPNTGNDIIGDALIFNGSITYLNWNGFDLQVKINNILNTKYFDPSNLIIGRNRQPQRTVMLKLTYNFSKLFTKS